MSLWTRLIGVTAGFGIGVLVSVAAFANPAGEAVTVEGLSATWVKPAGAKSAVLIIAGSGPTDRDGNNGLVGLKTDAYKQLADVLAKDGIASLRFDKRGVGASKASRDGKPLSEEAIDIHTSAADAVSLAQWMGKQPGITSIGFVGHSEGGLLALLAAKAQKVDHIVLLTTAGRPLGAVLRQQFDRQPMPELMKAEIERVLGLLEKGSDPGPLKAPLDQIFRVSVQPFLKSVLAIDPAVLVREQTAKILVVGGGADLQIGRFDFNALVEARPGLKSRWEPRMTHTLKQELDGDMGQEKTYTDPTLPLMPAVTAEILTFLKN